jgi:transcriptional regulator with XRE-family HTH domain
MKMGMDRRIGAAYTTWHLNPALRASHAEFDGKESVMESIGRRIARLRRQRGVTQADLARALGVSQPVVSNYEHDVIRLSGDAIVALAKILAVSADEILGLGKLARTASTTETKRHIYRQLESIDRLPKRDQEALARTIDAFLAKGQ